MPLKKLFDEPSKVISVRVPESKAEIYKNEIKEFVMLMYNSGREMDIKELLK